MRASRSSLPSLVARCLVFTSLISAGPSAPALAQDRAGTVYVSGGLAWAWQADGAETSATYTFAPGGSTVGWDVALGVLLTRRLAIEAEASGTGMMREIEPSRYSRTYHEERRDQFFGANLRVMAPHDGWALEPVVGLQVVRHQGWSATEYLRYTGPQTYVREMGSRTQMTLPRSLAVTAGLDARLGRGRISVVPSVRLRYRVTNRGDGNDLQPHYPGGVASSTLWAGISTRMSF